MSHPLTSKEATERSAILSPCGRYRYRLLHEWGQWDGKLVFVMLNPSTADAKRDDPTIRKCRGFAERLGFKCFSVVNLFAYRATDPDALRLPDLYDIVGPENDHYIRQETGDDRDTVVCGWGAHARHWPHRVQHVSEYLIPSGKKCLAVTADGHPRHPLMLPYSSKLQNWSRGRPPIARSVRRERHE